MLQQVQGHSRRKQIRFWAGLLAILLVAGCSSGIASTYSRTSSASATNVVTSARATRTLSTATPRMTKPRRPVRTPSHAPVVRTHASSTAAPPPSTRITHTAPPPPTTHAAAPPPTTRAAPPPPPRSSSAAAVQCYPLTNGGNCYEPGEYCRTSDRDSSGIAGDGEHIRCEDNNGWRWEPI